MRGVREPEREDREAARLTVTVDDEEDEFGLDVFLLCDRVEDVALGMLYDRTRVPKKRYKTQKACLCSQPGKRSRLRQVPIDG